MALYPVPVSELQLCAGRFVDGVPQDCLRCRAGFAPTREGKGCRVGPVPDRLVQPCKRGLMRPLPHETGLA